MQKSAPKKLDKTVNKKRKHDDESDLSLSCTDIDTVPCSVLGKGTFLHGTLVLIKLGVIVRPITEN